MTLDIFRKSRSIQRDFQDEKKIDSNSENICRKWSASCEHFQWQKIRKWISKKKTYFSPTNQRPRVPFGRWGLYITELEWWGKEGNEKEKNVNLLFKLFRQIGRPNWYCVTKNKTIQSRRETLEYLENDSLTNCMHPRIVIRNSRRNVWLLWIHQRNTGLTAICCSEKNIGEFYGISLDSTVFNRILLTLTEFYYVLLGLTKFRRILLDFMGFYWVYKMILDFLDFSGISMGFKILVRYFIITINRLACLYRILMGFSERRRLHWIWPVFRFGVNESEESSAG